MQERVTLKNRNKFKKVVCIVFIIAIIAASFCAITISVLKRKELKCFDETSYYFVYTHKESKRDMVTRHIDRLKSNGGAAVIHFYREDYYLLVSVYKTKEEAEEVQNNIKSNFPESGVLTLKTKKTNKKNKKEIKKDQTSLRLIDCFYSLCDNLMTMSMNYLSGKLSQNELSLELLKNKLEIEEILKGYNYQTESGKQIFNHLQLCTMQLDDFFNRFFESTKRESMVCEITVNMNLLRIELSNNL